MNSKKEPHRKSYPPVDHKPAAEDELIGGRQAVLEALRFGQPKRVYLAESATGEIIKEIEAEAALKRVPLSRLAAEKFDELTKDLPKTRGVTALVPPFKYLHLSDLIEQAMSDAKALARDPLIIVLDHVEDPQNLGAVMRTADAAGVDGLIIPERRAAGVTAAARRAASGAAERLPAARVKNLNQAVKDLKEAGFWIYGAEADGQKDYLQADYRRPLALVLGGEDSGLGRLLRKNCDLTVNIPMPGKAGSLNVSAAAAVLIYAALAKRREGF